MPQNSPWRWSEKAQAPQFLETPFVGPFGCGTARSFTDYETYAGISFRHRCTTDYTRLFLEPPNPPLPANWADLVSQYDIVIHLDKDTVDAVDGAASWQIRLYDNELRPLYHKREPDKDFREALVHEGATWMLRIQLASQGEPVLWQVAPYNAAQWFTPFQGASPLAELLPIFTRYGFKPQSAGDLA